MNGKSFTNGAISLVGHSRKFRFKAVVPVRIGTKNGVIKTRMDHDFRYPLIMT